LDWELASLVASVVIGAGGLGAVLTAFMRIRHEREQEWRRLLSEVAAEFSGRLAGAGNAVRHAVELAEGIGTPTDLPDAVDRANHLVNEASIPLARVQLLFFDNRDATRRTMVAFEHLRVAAESLRSVRSPAPGTAGVQAARVSYNRAQIRLAQFVGFAYPSLGRGHVPSSGVRS